VSPFDRPAIAWLGDDFTGAAAVMEVLSFSGLPSLLFLGLPTQAQLAQAQGLAGIGIASLARAEPPAWMDAHLPAYFDALDQTRAELIHYKICTTLDSAPHIGSIGRAIEIGRARFGEAAVPVVTAAPAMRRYQAFGSLFCAAGDGVYRLDRHPVMAQHPVTPMGEADVARHLAAQTDLPTGCIDLEALAEGRAEALLEQPQIWTLDLMRRAEEAEIGRLLWERREKSRFVVGSQGVEYALAAHFRAVARSGAPPPAPSLGHAAQFAVVSGSVSPISAAQIAHARDQGFAAIRLDVTAPDEADALAQAKAALSQGRPPLIYTAEGPSDMVAADQARIGQMLGRLLRALIQEAGLRRVAVSGGDTSGRVCTALGIYALEAAAPTIPGAAICRARAEGQMNGLEIALKGAQMGTPDYFSWVQDGGGAR
jgi:uncharacterized protein YgbK (DUF1537 family)